MPFLPRRLNFRVILLVSAILCLTGAMSGWVSAKRQSNRLTASMSEHASVMAGNFAMSCARFMVLEDYAELESFLLKSAELPDIVRLQVCEADGALIGDVKREAGGPSVTQLGTGRLAVPAAVSPAMAITGGRLVAWQPIVVGASMLGWVRAEYGMDSIRQARTETMVHSLLLALFWMACSALLVLMVLRPTARALHALTAFARRLDQSKGERIAIDHGAWEIEELEASLNYASEKLWSAEQQMLVDRERLRESEAMYRSLVMSMAEGVLFHSAGGEITAANPAAERILGKSAAQMLGSAADRQGEAVCEDGSPFPIDRHPALVTLRSAEPQHNVVMGIRRPEGSLVWISVNSQPLIREGETEPSAAVTTFHDVTERKRAEESLLHLAAIVEYSDDAIISKSLQGDILSWNRGAQRLLGYREAEVVGRSIALLIPPQRPTELSHIMGRIGQGSVIEHLETQRLHKDGSLIDVSLTISPLFDASGRIIGASTIARDISYRKRAELELRKANEELEQRVSERTADLNSRSEELAQSRQALLKIVDDLNGKTAELEAANAKLKELDRLKSMFVASMSHELRTPLNSIIGFSSVVLDEWLGPVNDEQKENLAIILRSGKHLLNLINDVIDVSKIEAGKIELLADEFELSELIEEALSLVRKEALEKGLELRLDAPPLLMRTDRRRLLQCVLNLFSNAVKFTERGQVDVQVRLLDGDDQARGALVEIAVADTGCGIREEDLPRMFQPFVRLLSPSQATVPGTGLGLYLTRKLAAEILKGELLLTSEYGKGSRFALRIPSRLPS